jgi:3-hydroxyisobutyrate dehydrogenase-like beta-hydroxyacid dehydrogenase
MLFAVSGGLADIVTMANANAIDAVEAMHLFTKFHIANSIAFRGPKMARGETTPASFELSMARKDVRLMTEAARGNPLLVLPTIARRMDEAIAAGKGRHDLAALGSTSGAQDA